jgi:hypothetical protein
MELEVKAVSEIRVRIRANRSSGELEVEGPLQVVTEWWDRLWPDVRGAAPFGAPLNGDAARPAAVRKDGSSPLPEIFGEYYSTFKPDVTDVDKILIAGAFTQGRDSERVFTTKSANQLLVDQNVKVTNASENVRRLIQTKRAFVVSEGKFRVSAIGLDYLRSLQV